MQDHLFQNKKNKREETHKVKGKSRPNAGRCQTWTGRGLSCGRPWSHDGLSHPANILPAYQTLPDDKQDASHNLSLLIHKEFDHSFKLGS
jgi:hypothetical protein